MENIYLLMLAALAFLAIGDLVVGVSNDAVNFLNSAIGSKAIPFKTILIVASLGIGIGAIFSGGMMEVARNGIFNPGEFVFSEIMIIFMAVMITDILLLDFFNTLGMPTSTTVSIVFELLGAAVAIALIKIGAESGNFLLLTQYINTTKASEIVSGIFLSVGISFTVGAGVQYLSRLLLTFDFHKKANWIAAIFGALALTSITFFVLIKGLKGSAVLSENMSNIINSQGTLINVSAFFIWFLICYLLPGIKNIYKLVIIAGTFSLALAFAGNDLVNFIGVPIAAFQSYGAWSNSGITPSEFSMDVLSSEVATPTLFLFLAGLIMVLTLWFSKKARHVTQTEINLSREGEAKEKFQPNFLSRNIVRGAMGIATMFNAIIPASAAKFMDVRFKKSEIALQKDKALEMPAFDMVRAAVNLMVAGILISIATSYKLPLSTTYVTFMVAMGTSLADRAWGSESAVYRVAGVLNVIGGWFITALIAFVAAATIAYLIHLGGLIAIVILLLLAVFLLVRNYINHTKKSKEITAEDTLRRSESSSIQGVISESAKNISNVVKRSNKIYVNTVEGLAKHDLNLLIKNKNGVIKLTAEIDDLRDHIFYFIKNLDDASVGASNFYINTLGYLQDMAQSLEYMTAISHKHVHNNHKKLKYNQIKELKELEVKLNTLFNKTKQTFDTHSFGEIAALLAQRQELFDFVTQKIERQIARTRTEESSPKNTTLYFTFLTETKDLIAAMVNLLELYYTSHDSTVKPTKIETKIQ